MTDMTAKRVGAERAAKPGTATPTMPVPETPASTSRRRGYVWGVLAALTCPCHLPVLALLLSGTAVGALITRHMGLAVIVGVVLFGTFFALAMRAFNARR